GAPAFTNGRRSITNSSLMRRALSYAKDFGAIIVHHTDDRSLSGDGVMNEGEMASRLGLPGIPKESEIIMLERDLRLAALTGGRYHAAAISCAESVELIARAKKVGLDVTAGASINNLTLNETDIGAYRTFFKLSPPLRLEEDRRAVVDAVANGTIDIVHSDHEPRDVDHKRHPFADAADGAIGLETLLPALMRLVHSEELSLMEAIRSVTANPASRFGLASGSLSKGMPADFVTVDFDHPWVLTEDALRSRSKNTAFEGARFSGKVLSTYIGGREVFRF
ncbi:MAG: amidohydrolase family protein, partial [Pseudomonadota bacterium]